MKRVENFLWMSGVLLIALYFTGMHWSGTAAREGVSEFQMQKQQLAVAQALATWSLAPENVAARSPSAVVPALVLQSARAPAEETATTHAAIAVLRIPRIALEVPVRQGTDEAVLRQGAGWVPGTAFPGQAGNVAIAAHRDSFFRGLKDVVVGDRIELETLDRVDYFHVVALDIVDPIDVHVLAPTSDPVLTLVTCYPFHFVGHAPQRYIVRAVAAGNDLHHPRRKT